ncbi:MAG: sensor histidine kinase [Akkermansiaceae bacterium]|nr:sensor histidine kinase [Akkermansiaceae bacterium]
MPKCRSIFHPALIGMVLSALFTGAQAQTPATIAELRAIPKQMVPEHPAVIVRGVAVSVRGENYPDFILQDATGALAIIFGKEVGPIAEGQMVEVAGRIDPSNTSMRILADRITPGEMVGLPAPVKVDAADLADGSKDCQYVELSGVIRTVHTDASLQPVRLILGLGPQDRRLTIWVSHFDEGIQEKLRPDTAVTVRGVCRSWRTLKYQPFGTFIVVTDPSSIRIDRAAASGLEDLPVRSLPEIFQLTIDDLKASRERIKGVVTLAWPDTQVVVENAEGSMFLTTGEDLGLRPGEEVDIAGFPTRRDSRVVMEDAVVIDESPATAENSITPLEITPGRLLGEAKSLDLDGRLLRIDGTFRQMMREDKLHLLIMEADDGREFQAILPVSEPLPLDLEAGARVRLHGVCRMLFTEQPVRSRSVPNSFELLLPDADAIRIIHAGPWWTTGRLLMVLATLFVILGISILWSLALRRQVSRRSELLLQEIRSRHDAELLAAERSRLASDLHDTLSQSLSGAAMQLEVAGALSAGESGTTGHFTLAKRLLARSREDLRRAVWDLNPSVMEDRDLPSALRKIAEEINQSGVCEVTVEEADGGIDPLPERMRTHLFRVGQEAINNALHHGQPRHIHVRMEAADGQMRLSVADDGRGFDPSTAPGPDQGHFGLSSLSERLIRLGGSLDITSSEKGTILTAQVPCDAA